MSSFETHEPQVAETTDDPIELTYEATTAAARALSNLNRSHEPYPPLTLPGSSHEVCGYPFPPNYRIKEAKPTRTGRWTLQEHKIFLNGVAKYGRTWTKVAEMVGTRSAGQVRSHAQKFDLRLAKELRMLDQRNQETGGDKEDKPVEPPPRKRGGGRPKGSTKEKIQERAMSAAQSQVPLRQPFQPYQGEGDPYFLDAQYHYREQQAALASAYGYHPPSSHSGPPLAYRDYHPHSEELYPSEPPYPRAPPRGRDPNYYRSPQESVDWRTPAAVDALMGRFDTREQEVEPRERTELSSCYYPPYQGDRDDPCYSAPPTQTYYLGKRSYDPEDSEYTERSSSSASSSSALYPGPHLIPLRQQSPPLDLAYIRREEGGI